MATSAAMLVQRTRRFVGDWPENDATTASVASNATTFTVADATIYSQGFLVQIDTEGMFVTAASGSTVTVRRAVRGTTAASHASGATVLARPSWLDLEYLDALNSGINATFPLLYKEVVDESTTTDTATYEYTIPFLSDGVTPIPYLSRLSIKIQSDVAFRDFYDWDVLRDSTPKIRLRRRLPNGTLRIRGFGPLPTLTDLTSSLDSKFPANAEDALTLYAAQYLLASGEAQRVRQDTGARDDRETAVTAGASMSASQQMLQRFYARLQTSAQPPMPKHVKQVI